MSVKYLEYDYSNLEGKINKGVDLHRDIRDARGLEELHREAIREEERKLKVCIAETRKFLLRRREVERSIGMELNFLRSVLTPESYKNALSSVGLTEKFAERCILEYEWR
jgi:ABC-type oligopeptide transport system ATPase subunit